MEQANKELAKKYQETLGDAQHLASQLGSFMQYRALQVNLDIATEGDFDRRRAMAQKRDFLLRLAKHWRMVCRTLENGCFSFMESEEGKNDYYDLAVEYVAATLGREWDTIPVYDAALPDVIGYVDHEQLALGGLEYPDCEKLAAEQLARERKETADRMEELKGEAVTQ